MPGRGSSKLANICDLTRGVCFARLSYESGRRRRESASHRHVGCRVRVSSRRPRDRTPESDARGKEPHPPLGSPHARASSLPLLPPRQGKSDCKPPRRKLGSFEPLPLFRLPCLASTSTPSQSFGSCPPSASS